MSSKRGNKNYYKGKGARPMGRSTKHGNYKIDAPAIAHAVYEEPDMAEPDEYWEPERLPTNRSKMQALVSDHCTAAILAPPPPSLRAPASPQSPRYERYIRRLVASPRPLCVTTAAL